MSRPNDEEPVHHSTADLYKSHFFPSPNCHPHRHIPTTLCVHCSSHLPSHLSLSQLILTIFQFIQHTTACTGSLYKSHQLTLQIIFRSQTFYCKHTTSYWVHTLSTCCPTFLLPLSTSVPLTVLKNPCKINSPPEQLVPFDKGQKVAHQITPRLASLAKTNQNASLVCGMGCSTFFIFSCWNMCKFKSRKTHPG